MQFSNIKIVLVEPSHPGNIGASARAMKTMGLTQLVLVNPREYPSAQATARAAGADDVLAQSPVYATLAEALHDCHLVVGCSARKRSMERVLLGPRDVAERITLTSVDKTVAFVFGREDAGLTNNELDCCQYLLHIDGNQNYQSLNLAAAVQIVAYELFTAIQATVNSEAVKASNRTVDLATSSQIEQMYQQMERVLQDIGFLQLPRSTKLMSKIRGMFSRSHLSIEEVNILRGMMSAAQGRKYRWQQRENK